MKIKQRAIERAIETLHELDHGKWKNACNPIVKERIINGIQPLIFAIVKSNKTKDDTKIEDLIREIVIESETTVGSYFSIYFAKSRKSWVVHYGQSQKVEAGDLKEALSMALEKLTTKRHKYSGHKYSLN